ncbi:MAG: hypothetical protein K8R87_07870 [Verrucomicrobia bacterium]|nr:hypothetical protein [Verrucomicrobiota bacterium]
MDNSPAPSKTARYSNIATKVISVIAILVVVLIFFGQKLMMGTKYKVSDKESVNYSAKATEDDAKKLGEILKSVGYFTGTKDMDVLLKKDEEGTVASFVLTSKWTDDEIVKAFQEIGEEIAKGLGKPLTIRLLDDHLNKKNEIKLP